MHRVRLKRVLALVLAVCMVAAYAPLATYAIDEPAAEAQTENVTEPEVTDETAEEPAEVTEEQGTVTQETTEETAVPAEKAAEETTEETTEEPAETVAEPEEEEKAAEPETEKASFIPTKSDFLSYDPLYVARYANDKYVDVSETTMDNYVNIVTAARGLATYNISKQGSFEVDPENFLGGMNYEMPVYNVDDNSKYYIAIPDVNLFNKNFKQYGMIVSYNNDYGETINGWKYEKGILYIPKSAFNRPKNDEGVPEYAPIAIQMNYAIGDDMDFSKSIPAQILDGGEPVDKTVHTPSIFDLDRLSIDTGIKGRKESDISVFLNGHMIPILRDAWSYDKSTGVISIQAMPGVVSNINVVFQPRKTSQIVKDKAMSVVEKVTPSAFADTMVNTGDMSYLRNGDGDIVILKNIKPSDVFVGWRGHYYSETKHKNDYNGVFKNLSGWANSVKYMYGGYTTMSGGDMSSATNKEKDAGLEAVWAFTSYAIGADVGLASDNHDITQYEKVYHYEWSGGEIVYTKSKTMYDWLVENRNRLEKSNGAMANKKADGEVRPVGSGAGNGLAGATNFGFHFPGAVSGCDGSLISSTSNEGRENVNLSFASDQLGTSSWLAASCNELDDAAESDSEGHIYVTCLEMNKDNPNTPYAVFAFVKVTNGQNACGIYKFRLSPDIPTTLAVEKKQSSKVSSNFAASFPGNYSLAGAEYTVYEDDACTKVAKDKKGNNAVLLTKITDGKAISQTLEMEPKSYWIKETKASKGYLLDSTVYPVTLKKGTTTVTTCLEDPTYGKIPKLVKIPKEQDKVDWARCVGAEYEFSYYDVDPSSTDLGTPKKTWTFKTRKGTAKVKGKDQDVAIIDFLADTPISGESMYRVLPMGVFTIKEVKEPNGMKLDKTVYKGVVKQPSNGVAAVTTLPANGNIVLDNDAFVHSEEANNVVIEVRKKAASNAANVSLKDAEYTVKNSGGTVVGVIKTDANGYGKLEKDTKGALLLPDTYTVYETKAPAGMLIEASSYTGDNKVLGPVKVHTLNATAPSEPNQVYTVNSTDQVTELSITKSDLTNNKPELAGAKLQIINPAGKVVEEWTSTTSAHKVYGLASGTYTLREITAPYGYDIAEDVKFTISDKQVVNKASMDNKPVTVKTSAVSGSTGKRVGSLKTNETITDTVHLTGLIKDRKYKISGKLMNKATGKEIGVTSSKEFTATAAAMDVKMDFTVNSTSFSGGKLVVFEKLFRETKVHSETVPAELQKHENINDVDQTITFPSISTVALDKSSQTHNILADKNAVIVDTVSYSGLLPGENYVLEGELYDKTAGKLLGVKATANLKPNSESGKATIEFAFNATGLDNHTLVVYETLKYGNTVLCDHKNPNDADQTMYVPKVGTTALDSDTNDHLSNADETVVVKDTVKCENLIVGQTYTIDGKLVYNDNGNDVLDNGKTVTATDTFKATATTMTRTLTFTFNGSALQGKTVVAFETLNINRKPVGTHNVLTDEGQSDHFPKIRTTALDSETKDHIALGDDSITITDTVAYENLIPGKTYTLQGVLMDKTTGKAVTGVTTKPVTFKADAAKGSKEITFVFNGKNWQNHKTVAFEELYLGSEVTTKNLIATHKDINDVDQTVNIPEGGTTLKDSKTNDHIAFGEKTVTLKDTVEYKNLLAGKEYEVTGTLMNKKTGEPIKVGGQNVTKTVPFKAEAENGSVVVEFTFDGSLLPGETIVAFETITYKKVPVVIHANINDKPQTVHVPKLRTSAAIQNENHEVKDIVTYENLLEGKKYVVRGWLVDTVTSEKVPGSDGKVDLDPKDKTSGQTEMILKTDKYDDMYGHSMTAFEELYVIEKVDGKDKEIKVAEHKDLKDKDQTVEIYHDIKVQKNVTGNLGDLTKVFEYTVDFTDLVANHEYKIEGTDAKSFKADSSGKATVVIKLRDDESAVIKQLPKSATYKITEAASDHVAQFDMNSEDMADKGAKIITKHASNGAEAAKILATAKETVDLFDGTVIVLWNNNRDMATTTAVPSNINIWLSGFAILLASALFVVIGRARSRRYEKEDI